MKSFWSLWLALLVWCQGGAAQYYPQQSYPADPYSAQTLPYPSYAGGLSLNFPGHPIQVGYNSLYGSFNQPGYGPGGSYGYNVLGNLMQNDDANNDGVPDFLQATTGKIDDYLAKQYKLGQRKLSVQVDYLNSPLEYLYLSQYHGFQNPLAGTPLGNYFGIPYGGNAYGQPVQPGYYGQTQPPSYGPAQPPSYGPAQPPSYGQVQPPSYG